ncbi:hypothetical protein Zmor_025689 [Zophobas morio]|uniref:Secreted protein n=1 Tax=Zophobas morio TaxID=2755281 RepID=A0AA38HXE6_9CUCU|nr:hypothetical protein Zmor_025689 [Zophobas morio]
MGVRGAGVGALFFVVVFRGGAFDSELGWHVTASLHDRTLSDGEPLPDWGMHAHMRASGRRRRRRCDALSTGPNYGALGFSSPARDRATHSRKLGEVSHTIDYDDKTTTSHTKLAYAKN